MNKKELQKLFMAALASAEEIRMKYQGKPKDMPGDEKERWQTAMADADTYRDQIDLIEKEEAHTAWSKEAAERLNIAGNSKSKGEGSEQAALARSGFVKILMGSERTPFTAQEIDAMKAAYQIDNPAGGGYFELPQELSNEILVLMKDKTYLRQMGRVFPLKTAGSLGVPAIDTDPSDDDWTTELLTGNEETTAASTKRQLKTNPMAKLVKMSRTLIRKAPNFEETLLDRLAYKAAITEEKGFLSGTGSQQPLGVFTASSNGISTGRDSTTANTTSIVADDLINCFFTLKAQYREKATWIFHRTVIKLIRELKDANNNYIWATGIGPGTGYQGLAPTLLGLPYMESEYAPSTVTAALYTGILGCFDYYWIADALDMEIQVLDQLYAATNQMGFILRKETDGMPVLEEAFVRLIQHA